MVENPSVLGLVDGGRDARQTEELRSGSAGTRMRRPTRSTGTGKVPSLMAR